MNKEYKVGDIFGYRFSVTIRPFNPYFPGASAQPRIDCETYLTGKQIFYCLQIYDIPVEGILDTFDDKNIPMRRTWDGWLPLEREDAPYETRDEAFVSGTCALRLLFERTEKALHG